MASTDEIRPARGTDTRRAILEAAMALYARGGVKGTGLAAIGLGIARFCMLRHGIDDIRLFYQNDVRFLRQF